MSNPLEFATSMEPPVIPEGRATVDEDDATDYPSPTDDEQPETQGEEPLDAELGPDGQGDIGGDVDPDLGLASAPSDLDEGTR